MTRIILLLLAGVGVALLPGDSPRAGCRHVAVRHVEVRPVVAFQAAYPHHYYSVGQGHQLRAAVEIAKEELRAEMRAMQQAAPTPETLPITAEIDPWSIAKANCQGCHATNENAKAAIDLSDFSALTCEQKLACIREIVDGSMPKGRKLDAQQLGDLIGTFSGSENVGK